MCGDNPEFFCHDIVVCNTHKDLIWPPRPQTLCCPLVLPVPSSTRSPQLAAVEEEGKQDQNEKEEEQGNQIFVPNSKIAAKKSGKKKGGSPKCFIGGRRKTVVVPLPLPARHMRACSSLQHQN